jgi:hypothetical protein
MPHIKMDEAETALFKEVGERGDAFRRAMHNREAELVRSKGWMVEAVDAAGAMVDHVTGAESRGAVTGENGEPATDAREAAVHAAQRPAVGLRRK